MHYGVEFRTSPIVHYVCGSVIKYDYVEAKHLLSMNGLKKNSKGVLGQLSMMYYIMINNTFKLLYSGDDIREWLVKHLPLRQLNVYVEVFGEDKPRNDVDGSSSLRESNSGENMDRDDISSLEESGSGEDGNRSDAIDLGNWAGED